jgi:hypothetical protein
VMTCGSAITDGHGKTGTAMMAGAGGPANRSMRKTESPVPTPTSWTVRNGISPTVTAVSSTTAITEEP